MTVLIRACTDPFTNITGPLYHLVKGDGKKVEELEKLILATLRTATAAAFFFMIIPFNYIFGHHDNLSGSFAFASQFLIHPYAASLFNAFINGGYTLVTKVLDVFAKRQLIFTRDDLGGVVRAIGFCTLAHYLQAYSNLSCFNLSTVKKSNPLYTPCYIDTKYQEWAGKFARWYCNRV
jgi:hypothetical protein